MSTSFAATSTTRPASGLRRTWRPSLAVLVVAGACALSVGPAPQPASAATVVAVQPLHISPGGAGLKNGSSWRHAGDLKDLPRFIAARPSGGEVWVRGDAGPYNVKATVHIKAGGSAGAPVVVRGVAADGSPSAVPVLIGTRTSPYRVGGTTGGEVFKLYSGAKHLVFSNLAFRNQGTAFTAGGNTQHVQLTDMSATNVRRFFENYRASGETSANVSDITLRRIDVRGFSKSVLRLQYDSNNVLVEDVHGDSEQQDGDDFAMGVHLSGTVHDVVLRRVTMRNAKDTLHTYWNGDGFATERSVYNVLLEDTNATGSTDGGYDLKSRSTTLVRAAASGNKRNFRFWASDTVVSGCTAADPVKRGGSSSQAQVWLGTGAKVVMRDCIVRDDDSATVVFQLEPDSHLSLQGGSVSRAAGSRLSIVESGATLQFQDTVQSLS